MALLGYYPGVTLRDMALWLLVTPIAVLLHELGHAVVARGAGAQPRIDLAGFGGVTSYVPPRPLSRGRSLAIAVAGPAVGLAVGGALVIVYRAIEPDLEPGSWQRTLLWL